MSEDPQFNDEKFMSASEKKLVLSAWKTFLKHGCQFEHFTEKLYHHLSQRCSFIAHYDRRGFYAVYFEIPGESSQRFLDQFDPQKPGISAEYGNRLWLTGYGTGRDLNQAMRDVAGAYIPKLRFQFFDAERTRDLHLAAALATKHGKRIADLASSPAEHDCLALPLERLDSSPHEEQLSIFGSLDAST